ncbi:hypothetical protein FACS189444_5260 [Spirochaetia bacterium]|nr:hypothetical protein FACS189444_5260 [Spirochaetia bacterium]
MNSIILDGARAEYGKKIVTTLSQQLVKKYGTNFTERNIYRMMLFAERFSDSNILPPLTAKLSWSHFIELLPLKSDEARLYYANDAAVRNYGAKKLADEFKDDCVFFGSIDENEPLIHGTEEAVREGTRRTIDALGKYGRYIVAASHDWLLPEVPAKNIIAMYDEAKSYKKGAYNA